MIDGPLLALCAVVLVANAVQTAIGFGSMVICMTIAASFWPVLELPPLLVPLSIAQTGLVILRHHHAVDRRLLLRRVLPLMGGGTAVGLAIAGIAEASWVRPALGALILTLAGRELWRARLTEPPPPPSPAVSVAALLGAGVVHGVYATGGPLLVWALGREDLDRHTFRATLTAVWLILGVVLLATFVARDQVTAVTLTTSGLLAVPMLVGIGVGEAMHARVDEARFRTVVWGVLALAALPLIVK